MKAIRFILLAFFLPLYCVAWNGSGHMTGGAIAYYYLKTHNPTVLQKVINDLKRHRWYNNPKWHDKLAGLTQEQQNVALFMLASTYPDDARDSVHLGGVPMTKWHYINLPIVFPGSNIKPPSVGSPNAQQKILEFISSTPKEKNPSIRAINIAWLFHLIEDIHQPLHTVALFDSARPNGDNGGGKTFLKINSNQPIKMHTYWDGLINGSFKTIPTNAQQLLALPAYRESALIELKSNLIPNDWILKESYSLAKAYCYSNGTVIGTETQPSIISEQYIQNAKGIAQKRIVLAGIRLAKTLSEIYK